MSSSPRFWQKLGLRKQSKSSSSSTANSDKQDNISIHSSISLSNVHDATLLDNNSGEKPVKRFSSNISLRHRSSSASLREQMIQSPSITAEKQIRRTSLMKPLRRIDPEESISNNNNDSNDISVGNYKKTGSSLARISSDIQQQRKLPITSSLPQLQQTTKKQSLIDIDNNNTMINTTTTSNRLPPRLKRTKSNQSLKSTSTITSIGSNSRPSIEYHQQKSPNTSSPTTVSNGASRLRQPSPAFAHAKLLTHSESNNSLNSAAMMMMPPANKKSLPKLNQSNTSGDDDNNDAKSCLTRSSSNGSSSTVSHHGRSKRKSSLEKRRSKQQLATLLNSNTDQSVSGAGGGSGSSGGQDFIVDMLKGELERERASTRSLQGQKEAIAKDLDYFCNLVDEVTEEKDEYKTKYEQEKLQNKELKKSLENLESHTDNKGVVSTKGVQQQRTSQLKLELETVQQQATEEQYIYYNNLQCKNDEIDKLKHDLKQAQIQIQVLRKTMKQMLKADGKDFDESFDFGGNVGGDEEEMMPRRKSSLFDSNGGGEKYLLLQSGYHPDHQSQSSASSNNTTTRPTTSPPSPMPCYSATTTMSEERHGHDGEEDLLSTTSRESFHSNSGNNNYRTLRHQSQQYEFLKYNKDDDHISLLAKRKSTDFSKKMAMSRRRKDQLEEMLGEVDSQLNKVKQKIRPL